MFLTVLQMSAADKHVRDLDKFPASLSLDCRSTQKFRACTGKGDFGQGGSACPSFSAAMLLLR